MCFQDAPYSLYPAQCGPWHWAGEKSLPNYHSARWHSMAFIALAPVLWASNCSSLPPFLASCFIPTFPQLGYASPLKLPPLPQQNYGSTPFPFHAVIHTEHFFHVCWIVICCLSCFYFGWTLGFSLMRVLECIFWTVVLKTVRVTPQLITTRLINFSHVIKWGSVGEDAWAHGIALFFHHAEINIVEQVHALNHNECLSLWIFILAIYMSWFKFGAQSSM